MNRYVPLREGKLLLTCVETRNQAYLAKAFSTMHLEWSKFLSSTASLGIMLFLVSDLEVFLFFVGGKKL